MTLNQLIQQLCPNGVPFKKLLDIGTFKNGLNGKKKVHFIDGNKLYVSYLTVFSNIEIKQNPKDYVLINGDEKQNIIEYGDILFTTSSETLNETGMSCVVTYHPSEPVYLNSFCFIYRLDNKDLLDPQFTKFLFRSENIRKQIINCVHGVTRYNLSKILLKDILIPIPPIEIQKKIVNFLNLFTELNTELNTEYTKRKKQYNWYLNNLLDFESGKNKLQSLIKKFCPNSVEYKNLANLFDLRIGYTPSTKNIEYWENGTFPWFTMQDIRKNGNILYDSIEHVTQKAVRGNNFIKPNSFIVATSATIGDFALIKCNSIANQRFTVLSLKKEFNDVFDVKFLFYYFHKLKTFCEQHSNVSSFAQVDMNEFKLFKIPLPPLEVQQKIVHILDKSNTLTNDLNVGLPKEIELINKQYNYYLNKLLSFKELKEENHE